MAHDDEFIIGGRRRNSSSSQGTPKTSKSQGGGSAYSGIKLGKMPGGNMSFAGGMNDNRLNLFVCYIAMT